MIKNVELAVPFGNYREIDVQIVDENDNPVDLTGAEIRFSIKRTLSDPDSEAILTKTTVSGDVVILDEQNGVVKVILEPDETKIDAGVYRFDIKIYRGEEVYTVTLGKLIIEGVVWRDENG